jgi:hypothetical protein
MDIQIVYFVEANAIVGNVCQCQVQNIFHDLLICMHFSTIHKQGFVKYCKKYAILLYFQLWFFIENPYNKICVTKQIFFNSVKKKF